MDEFETKRLEETITLAKKQLKQAKEKNKENKSAIISAKKELRENTSHSISGLWSSEGFEALVELSQYTNPVAEKIADYEEVDKKIILLEKVINNPYFARIDFKFDGDDTFEKIYIGRSSLKKENSYEIAVYDWRSPIASVFYRFVLGKAFYDAPAGRITGEVNLKRQYEINNGVLEYFFDADVQITDDFLKKLLSQNTSPQMKAIVETIQKEQDIVIRDIDNDLMMVQGAAGSGKTSIALHRAAYLMYRGLASKLSSDSIMIISPNSLFEQYISNVLPELGEENVVSAVFEEILAEILQKKHIQSRNQFLENIIQSSQYRDLIKSSIEFKTSCRFLELLNLFIYDVKNNKISEFTGLSIESLYKKLFYDKEYFYSLSGGIELPDCIEELLVYTQENLDSNLLYYDDAAALAYLNLKFNGINEYKHIKHVVIDEAQDYYPLHYEIFHLMFPHSKFTILGDINQTLEKSEDLSLYEKIGIILKKKKSTLVTMNKSFRCTNEILTYSSKFIEQHIEIKSFNRKGDKPELFTSNNLSDFKDLILSEIRFCLGNGYRSIGLICKSKKNALFLFELLDEEIDVQLIKDESTSDLHGVFIIPVYMSKGLEFDAVLICDVDKETYYSKDDKRLLYIECTRALHRLNLFCLGEISPLL